VAETDSDSDCGVAEVYCLCVVEEVYHLHAVSVVDWRFYAWEECRLLPFVVVEYHREHACVEEESTIVFGGEEE
jgi:hypothetical protein